MATTLRSPDDIDLSVSRRALILVWQNPVSRRFTKVGRIDALPDQRFAFQYLPGASEDAEFAPLDEYPQFGAVYVSDEVPAFFANRILSAERRGYDRYLEWLGISGLDDADIPFEVLARTGGGRATDTFHVVDLPVARSDAFTSRFFVSGIRYTPGVDRVLASIHDGSTLALALEESNEHNPRAVLVNTVDNQRVGYVPDWLCGDVHALIRDGWTITATAEHVNPDAPAHVKVLCRIDAERP